MIITFVCRGEEIKVLYNFVCVSYSIFGDFISEDFCYGFIFRSQGFFFFRRF